MQLPVSHSPLFRNIKSIFRGERLALIDTHIIYKVLARHGGLKLRYACRTASVKIKMYRTSLCDTSNFPCVFS